MPLYEYRCEACGHHFEQIQKFSDPAVEVCPNCGERQVQKLLSSPAIQFKGSGWYITDYARKGAEGKDARESKEKTSGGDAKPAASESKSTGTESKSSSSDSSPSSSSSSTSSPPATSSSKS